MFKISVPDMMCENCVKRITNALNEAELKFGVDLDSKTVTIDGCQHCLKTALNELAAICEGLEAEGLALSAQISFGRILSVGIRPQRSWGGDAPKVEVI